MLQIKLFVYELEPLMNFLDELDIAGKKSRMRTRMIKLLLNHYNLFMEEYKSLLKEYAHLDEHGEPKQLTVNGIEQFDMKPGQKEPFQKEYRELIEETVVIDQIESNKEMLLCVKELVLNCDIPFKGDQAFLYDRFCDMVEAIDDEIQKDVN